MKGYYIASMSFFLWVTTVNGLKCYHCVEADGPDFYDTTITEHDSCGGGDKPSDDFLIECDSTDMELMYIPTSTDDTSSANFSCGKITLKGKYLDTEQDSKEKAEITFRSCLLVPQLSNGCQKNKKSAIVDEINQDWLKEWVQETLFDDDADVSICTCSLDNCNTATKSTYTGLLSISIAFLLSTLL